MSRSPIERYLTESDSFPAKLITGLLSVAAMVDNVLHPLGHDTDTPVDGAEQLAEREAEEEVHEPRPPGFYTKMGPRWADLHYRFPYPPSDKEHHIASDGSEWVYNNLGGQEWDAISYPPDGDPYAEVKKRERGRDAYRDCPDCGAVADETGRCLYGEVSDEPPLTNDELWALRGLINERYPLQAVDPRVAVFAEETAVSPKAVWCDEHHALSWQCEFQDHVDPPLRTTSDTVSQPSVRGEGSSADSGNPPPPAGEHPNPVAPNSQWSVLADRLVNHLWSPKPKK